MSTHNLLTEMSQPNSNPLKLIKFDTMEKPLVLFTANYSAVKLHYLNDVGYVQCNGTGCPACSAGSEIAEKHLLPAFDYGSDAIGVLSMSPAMKPGALRPQIIGILKKMQDTNLKFVAFIKRDKFTYSVSSRELSVGNEDGAAVIQTYLSKAESAVPDLTAVYPKLSNSEIAATPDVARNLKLKGVQG